METLCGFPVRRKTVGLNGFTLYFLPPYIQTIGMCFVLRSPSGRVAVIDGGYCQDADHLEELVSSLRPDRTIDLWLITHGHEDHAEAAGEILARKSLNVKTFVYDFPDESYWKTVEPTAVAGPRARERFLALVPNSGAEIVHPEKGETIVRGEFRFRVLTEARTKAAWDEGNNSDLVFKWYTGGADVLFLGDCGLTEGRDLLRDYPEELPCPVVQMAHHGQNGAGREIYEAIRPTVALWATPDWLWDNRYPQHKTIEVRGWMKALGAENFVSKDGAVILD